MALMAAAAVAVAAPHMLGQPGEVGSLAVLLAVAFAGPAAFSWLATRLDDARLRWLGLAFSIKLLAGVGMLFYGWTPQLSIAAVSRGYDPQRYYFQAQALAEAGFDTAALPVLNYTGILFYFGVAFEVLGHNPLVPLLVNSVTTLMATVLVVRLAYAVRSRPRRSDWTVGLCLLVPEVIWFDALPSRETLTMALATTPLALVGLRTVSRDRAVALPLALLGLAAVALLAIVRTPAVLPLAVAAALIVLSASPGSKRARRGRGARVLVVVFLAACALVVTPVLSRGVGSYSATFADSTANVIGASSTGYEFTEDSLALRFAPSNAAEVVLFAPLRMGGYLLAPFPDPGVAAAGLTAGAWQDWQNLAALLSTLLYLALLPMICGGLWASVKRAAAARVITVPAVVLMASVAINNIIIHPRYRLMVVPLLIATAWIGRDAGRRFLQTAYLVWGGVALGAGTVIGVAGLG